MRNRLQGSTVTEYAIILGLVTVLSIAGLTMLGGSTKGLVQGNTAGLTGKQAQSIVSMEFGGQNSSGTSMRQLVLDPSTGLPTMMVTAGSSSGTNTTSTEGMTAQAQHTIDLASTLQESTDKITDPATLEWARQITRSVYYLGGAEGSIAGIDALSVTDVREKNKNITYTDANALKDIYKYQNDLLTMIQNPPAGADTATINSLAMDAWNSAQGYVQMLSPYIKTDGSIDNKALTQSDYNTNVGNVKLTKDTYDSLVDYEDLQQNTEQVLNDGSATGTPTVQTTLESGSALDEKTSTP